MLLTIIKLLFSPDEPAKESDEDAIILYLGPPGSIENRIMKAMKKEADECVEIKLCLEPHQGQTTAVWAKGMSVIHGWGPACRYLGRLCHMYPSTPEHALILDEAFDELSRFMRPFVELESDALTYEHNRRHVKPYLERLEKNLKITKSERLYGFDGSTVADVCWRAAIEWVLEWHIDEDDPEQFLFEYGGAYLSRWFFDEDVHSASE